MTNSTDNSNTKRAVFDLATLQAETVQGSLYDGQLVFKARLHSATPEAIRRLSEERGSMTETEQILDTYRFLIERDLLEWNLTLDGEPIPLDAGRVLSLLPLTVLQEISSELAKLRVPEKRNGAPRGGQRWN